jgi:cell division protein FtsL
MFRLSLFLAVVAAAVAAALVLIGERAAATRAGYRVADLERQKPRLVEENRRLEAEVAKLKAPLRLYERAKSLEVNAEPPEERLKRQHEKAAKSR